MFDVYLPNDALDGHVVVPQAGHVVHCGRTTHVADGNTAWVLTTVRGFDGAPARHWRREAANEAHRSWQPDLSHERPATSAEKRQRGGERVHKNAAGIIADLRQQAHAELSNARAEAQAAIEKVQTEARAEVERLRAELAAERLKATAIGTPVLDVPPGPEKKAKG